MSKVTPMLQQYIDIKKEYASCILFFRLGDFYEMFFEDAVIASRELEIVLTSRENGSERIPMCGIPYHAASGYLAKLLTKGYKVAICEQVEDPKLAKGIVKRERMTYGISEINRIPAIIPTVPPMIPPVKDSIKIIFRD